MPPHQSKYRICKKENTKIERLWFNFLMLVCPNSGSSFAKILKVIQLYNLINLPIRPE